MTSKVAIANRALTKLGEARIISLDDNKKAPTTLNSIFDSVRDAELREHRWSFAKTRKTLPALSARPAFGYSHQYQLPTDFVSLIQVGDLRVYPRIDTGGLFSLEDQKILINMPAPLKVHYIRRVEDPNLYDPLFVEVLACRLATEACEDITQSETKFTRLAQQYQRAVRAAVRANALERPSQPIHDDTWLTSRR